jgi:large subunit ribosomal protein L29
MKAAELRDLSADELQGKSTELQEELFNLRFQLATGQIENVSRIRTVRRDLARVKTIQREREFMPSHSPSATR